MEHRSFSLLGLILTPLIIVGSQGGVLVLPSPQVVIDAHTVEPVAMEKQGERQYCSLETLQKLSREIADNPADSPIAVENFLRALKAASPEAMKWGRILKLLVRFTGTPLLQRALGLIALPDVCEVIESIRLAAQNATEQSYLELINFYHTCLPEMFSVEELRFIGLFCLCAVRNPRFNKIKHEVEWFKEHGLFETVMNNSTKYGEKLLAHKFAQEFAAIGRRVIYRVYCCSPLHALIMNIDVDFQRHRILAINYVLQQGISPEVCDHEGRTALECALKNPTWYKEDCGRKLVLLFHKYAQKDSTGMPLLLRYIYGSEFGGDAAFSRKQETIVAVALRMCHGLASAVVIDKEGSNPLHAAVIANNGYLAELIYILNRELASIPNNKGETPLALARELRAWKAFSGMARGSDYFKESNILREAIAGNETEIVKNIIIEAPELYSTTVRVASAVPEVCESLLTMDLKYALSQNKLEAAKAMVAAAYFLSRQREERASLSYKMAMMKAKAEELILPVRKLLSYFK